MNPKIPWSYSLVNVGFLDIFLVKNFLPDCFCGVLRKKPHTRSLFCDLPRLCKSKQKILPQNIKPKQSEKHPSKKPTKTQQKCNQAKKPTQTLNLLIQQFCKTKISKSFFLIGLCSQEKASSWEESFLKLQNYFFLLLQMEISYTLKAHDWMSNIWDS